MGLPWAISPGGRIARTPDEIGDLAQSLNFMAEQLRDRIEEVSASRTKLEAVFLSMVDGVMVLDRQGRIILVNQGPCGRSLILLVIRGGSIPCR